MPPSFFEEWADAHRAAKRIVKQSKDPIEMAVRIVDEIFAPSRPKKKRRARKKPRVDEETDPVIIEVEQWLAHRRGERKT